MTIFLTRPSLPHSMTQSLPKSIWRYALSALFCTGAMVCFSQFSQTMHIRRLNNAVGVEASQLLTKGLPENASAALNSAYVNLALRAPSLTPVLLENAKNAALKVVRKSPENLAVWNQLTYIDIIQHQNLTKEGLAALIKSYEVSPYGDVGDMIWRVEFATQYWSSLPDASRLLALGQIDIIGRFGVTWPWRIEQCKTNPVPTIRNAICAIAPGVDPNAP